MAKFIKGDVVVVPFPFSNLAYAKRRPAFVLAVLPGDDIILCQITSRDTKDEFALRLRIQDFESGSLPLESNIRPNRLFTADSHIVLYKIGHLNRNKIIEIISKVIKIISA
jgi:mRNA interferase MazF